MRNPSGRCAVVRAIEQSNSKIQREMERFLNRIRHPDGPSLFIRLCMIGRKGEKTNPTIMIWSSNGEARKQFEASVRESGILNRYPELQLNSCAPPFEITSVPPPLLGPQAGGPDASTANRIGPKPSDSDTCEISGPRMGRRLEFIVSSEAGLHVQNATGGLIVRIDHELYQITTFQGTTETPSWAPRSVHDHEKRKFDSYSDSEDSGYEQLFTSEKSLFLETRTGRDEKSHLYGQHPPCYTRPHPSEIICSPPTAIDGGIDQSLMWKDHDIASATPTLMKSITASRREDSHYTLVKLSELESGKASNVVLRGGGHVPPNIEVLDVDRVGTEPASVLVVTNRGPISGTLLPDVASLRLCGLDRLQTVHAVILAETCEPGDSGSAVVDATTGSCYGHIILEADGHVVAYMVPAPDTLAEIVLNSGKLPSLQLDRHIDTKHSNTVERWKCVNPRGNTNCHPLSPLTKCASCSTGKLYSARSRAAAHLRRNHFPDKPSYKKEGGPRGENFTRSRLPPTELKKWTREIAVTPLYARVMQAESDSDSDYENDADDIDDESDKEPPSASPTTMGMTDPQAVLKEDNEDLRRHNGRMKQEIKVLEDDIDVLMQDREELKQELESLRKRLREQEA